MAFDMHKMRQVREQHQQEKFSCICQDNAIEPTSAAMLEEPTLSSPANPNYTFYLSDSDSDSDSESYCSDEYEEEDDGFDFKCIGLPQDHLPSRQTTQNGHDSIPAASASTSSLRKRRPPPLNMNLVRVMKTNVAGVVAHRGSAHSNNNPPQHGSFDLGSYEISSSSSIRECAGSGTKQDEGLGQLCGDYNDPLQMILEWTEMNQHAFLDNDGLPSVDFMKPLASSPVLGKLQFI
ncbi:hypothetical protein B0T17DRAFT_650740 [Bombardia bombarda]|uniref:Uncharacterized protein n=1 Tax=Bombardia bombarda TaxID=252184 RepID=A0AA40CFR3_9PEZI|nr:hypothetical protein B0T17DRAFT_650740 [Bombardia bombarda]